MKLKMIEQVKKLAFESEKIFDEKNHGIISSSYSRMLIRNKFNQFIIDNFFKLMTAKKQREFIKELGFFNLSECAKLMGFSRQYVHRELKEFMNERVYWNKKFWYKPINIKKNDK